MNRATVIVGVEEGEEVTITVVRRRVERTPAGPGLAARVVETEGEPTAGWAEVVEIAAARARRAS